MVKVKYCSLLFYFFIVGLTNIVGQQYQFTNYDVRDGIPNSNINAILQDSRGFVWVGTQSGCAIFDSYSWKTNKQLQEINSPVVDIYEDTDNSIWFATIDKGAYKYNGIELLNYSSPQIEIIAICSDNEDHIWIATKNDGIFKIIDENTLNLNKQEQPLNSMLDLSKFEIFDMINDYEGNIWIGTNKGLYKFDGFSIEAFTLFDGLPHNKVLRIFEDKQHKIWFSTPRGIVNYNYDRFQVFNQQFGLNSSKFKAISQDIFGNMWFGGENGINIFNGEKIEHITSLNGLVDDHINIIQLDQSGNMWIGTEYGGLSMFADNFFSKFTIQDGLLSNQIFSLSVDLEDNIFIGTLDGINYIKSKELTHSNFNKLNLNVNTSTIYIDKKNRKWLGTNIGLFLYDNEFTKFIGNDSSFVYTILEDSRNQIWVGKKNGIYQIVERNSEFDLVKHSSISVICSYKDQLGNLWFGSFDKGLLKLEDNKLKEIQILEREIKINTIASDQNGNLWCGTEYNGVLILKKNENNEWLIYKSLNPETGLQASTINSLLFYEKNNCVIGTNRGILKLSFDSIYNIINQKKIGISKESSIMETSRNAIAQSKGGKIIIGTLNGLVLYNPFQEEFNIKPPTTHITKIKIDHEDIDWENSEYSEGKEIWFDVPKELVLPPDVNHITIEFTGINFKSQNQVKYQWKLSPLEVKWSPPSDKTEVSYPELPSGNYTFKVNAINEDGTASITPTVFKFIIEAPFYKSLWFIISLILLIGGIGLAIFKIRTEKLKRDKYKLEVEVAKRTQQLLKEKRIVEEKNKKIKQQAEELETQTEKLFQYNNILQNQNRDITDSINYARTIQKAVLGPSKNIRNILPKSFILYCPKDIVSGDFYWYSKHEQYIYIAAADCTGHGVPGAFMSIIGYNLLKELIASNVEKTASELLSMLNIQMLELLSKHNKDGFSKNGMDIALCRLDIKNSELNFAGAMRPLYFLEKENSSRIKVIKGDRHGIGYESQDYSKINFTDKFIDIKKGDRCYIFTDGYIDQFGGQHDKKYLGKRFRKNLIELYNTPIDENKSELYKSFVNWKGLKGEQTDDILIIGLEF